MKLHYAKPSPYSSKVRMAARHLGLAVEDVPTQTGPEADELNAANPLGKIPCLVLDDGTAVFDSRAIMQEMNRMERNRLFPSGKDKRRAAERLEALADGMCDAMLLMVYEGRYRPEEKRHEDWVEMQWSDRSCRSWTTWGSCGRVRKRGSDCTSFAKPSTVGKDAPTFKRRVPTLWLSRPRSSRGD